MKTFKLMLAAAMALGIWLGPLHADEAAVEAAQSVIARQLQAFLADAGEAAYSHAAPNIKRIFPNSEAFMSMVRNGYPQVQRPQNYEFGKAEVDGNRITQEVLILGPDGKDYRALYTLELQRDGVYRITGVSLRASNTFST